MAAYFEGSVNSGTIQIWWTLHWRNYTGTPFKDIEFRVKSDIILKLARKFEENET